MRKGAENRLRVKGLLWRCRGAAWAGAHRGPGTSPAGTAGSGLTSALPSEPNSLPILASRASARWGPGFRISFPHRNRVWWLVLSPGHRGPLHIRKNSGHVGLGPALSTATPSLPASFFTGSGLQAESLCSSETR